MAAITRHFGNDLPEIIVEPGRSIVGDAGVIQSEVVLISHKAFGDDKRWVYLDVGKFNGLAETMDESIKYRIETPADGGADRRRWCWPARPATAPTSSMRRPSTAAARRSRSATRCEILSTGAYTSSYASVGFNGFSPLKTYCI